MASPATTTAFQSTTNPGGNLTASTYSAALNADEINNKPSYSSKAANGRARLSENAPSVPGVQRQAPPAKAWTTSPLNTRTASFNRSNGTSTQDQNISANSEFAPLREGLKVTVTLDSGIKYEGTYSVGNESSHTLTMVQQKKYGGTAEMPNGNAKATMEKTRTFQKSAIADIHVTGSALPNRSFRTNNGNSTGFRTDTAISGNRAQGERVLQPWVPDQGIDMDMSLESSRNRGSTEAGWDQFEANRRLFGVETDYDESIYTTTIDKSHPEYHRRLAEAERKAREIENSLANNSHVAEERVRDNLTGGEGLDEEDKYSGVHRQDYPPLMSSNRADKYTPPARRPQQPQPAAIPVLNDPAIISSSISRKDSPAGNKSNALPNRNPAPADNVEVEKKPAQQATEAKAVPQPETKVTTADRPSTTDRTTSPQDRAVGAPNATATVERDVVSAFRGFAAQQRSQAEKSRINKAKADRKNKLEELIKFSSTFQLNSPVPSDLIPIIAKDPAKQREIQEKAKKEALEQEKVKQAKLKAANDTASSTPSTMDIKATQQLPTAQPSGPSTSASSSRQSTGRTPPHQGQAPYNAPAYRSDRQMHVQPGSGQNGRPMPGMGARMRSLDPTKPAPVPSPLVPTEVRQPPTGPSGGIDISRRSSGAFSNRLNPNMPDFKPRPDAANFNPNGFASRGSSPRSNSTSAPGTQQIVPASSLIRRKPLAGAGKTSVQTVELHSDIIETIAALQAPQGVGKKWETNGNMKPPYDTPPTWRQPADNEPAESLINQTYAKLFENAPYTNPAMSSPQPPHMNPQLTHQHQIPFHMQQGMHNMGPRQSPRQPQMHLHNNQHPHPPNAMFNPADDHRMMVSNSAQSLASPRLQAVNMVYPSPMAQPAQLAGFNSPMLQYPLPHGAPMPQPRSFSGGAQFFQPQGTHMSGPVMMMNPGGPQFIGPGMVPGPQAIYPTGQPHYMPQNTMQPPMPSANGYPSPGRNSSQMMIPQGSQQGHSAYSMSPGMAYQQPIYAQAPPAQMAMRYAPTYGTSPQMNQYGSRGSASGSFKQSYMHQHGPHIQNSQTQVNGPPRPLDGGDDAK